MKKSILIMSLMMTLMAMPFVTNQGFAMKGIYAPSYVDIKPGG
ncbi:hypothetical protein [Bacillus cereus]|nr:hypothetical protein [Bacillus cereus]